MSKESRHGMPMVVAALVAVSFLTLNLDGYQIHLASQLRPGDGLRGPGEFRGEPPISNWIHGWPFGFAMRSSIAARQPSAVRSMDQFSITSRWLFVDTRPKYFFAPMLALDVLIGMCVTGGAFVFTRMLAQRFRFRLTFRISTLLAVTAIVALALPFSGLIFASRYALQIVSIGTVGLGAVSTLACLLVAAARLATSITRRCNAVFTS